MKTSPALISSANCQPVGYNGTETKQQFISPENQCCEIAKVCLVGGEGKLSATETNLLKNYSQFFIALS